MKSKFRKEIISTRWKMIFMSFCCFVLELPQKNVDVIQDEQQDGSKIKTANFSLNRSNRLGRSAPSLPLLSLAVALFNKTICIKLPMTAHNPLIMIDMTRSGTFITISPAHHIVTHIVDFHLIRLACNRNCIEIMLK